MDNVFWQENLYLYHKSFILETIEGFLSPFRNKIRSLTSMVWGLKTFDTRGILYRVP